MTESKVPGVFSNISYVDVAIYVEQMFCGFISFEAYCSLTLYHLSHKHNTLKQTPVQQVKGSIVKASPYTACEPVNNASELKGRIALALRGGCMFAAKARWLQQAGAIGVIFIGEDHNSEFI